MSALWIALTASTAAFATQQLATEVTTSTSIESQRSDNQLEQDDQATDRQAVAMGCDNRSDHEPDTFGNPFGNCGFERGLDAWQVQRLEQPFVPLDTRTAGPATDPLLEFFDVLPTEGSAAAVGAIDGHGPGRSTIAQVVTLPFWAERLLFDYRAAWDLTLGQVATLPRSFEVAIYDPISNDPLARFEVLATGTSGLRLDTGSLEGSVHIARFAGHTVRVSFEWIVPESQTGPGIFQLDNVRLAEPTPIECGTTRAPFGLLPASGDASLHRRHFQLSVPGLATPPTLLFAAQPADAAPSTGSASTANQQSVLIKLRTVAGQTIDQGAQQLWVRPGATADQPAPVPGAQTLLVTVESESPAAQSESLDVLLTSQCTSQPVHSFSTNNTLTTFNDFVGSAGWQRSSDCPEDKLPGHTPGGAMRWGNPYTCTDYATAGSTTDQLVYRLDETSLPAPGLCPSARYQLAFNYLLDLEDDAEFDRVSVELRFDSGQTTTLLNNGSLPGGLSTSDHWQSASAALPLGARLPGAPTARELRFVATTQDDLNNYGRGFLIDDVRIECRNATIGRFDFEVVETSASEPAEPPARVDPIASSATENEPETEDGRSAEPPNNRARDRKPEGLRR